MILNKPKIRLRKKPMKNLVLVQGVDRKEDIMSKKNDKDKGIEIEIDKEISKETIRRKKEDRDKESKKNKRKIKDKKKII